LHSKQNVSSRETGKTEQERREFAFEALSSGLMTIVFRRPDGVVLFYVCAGGGLVSWEDCGMVEEARFS